MEVGRVMFSGEDADHDAVEAADLRHLEPVSGSCRLCSDTRHREIGRFRRARRPCDSQGRWRRPRRNHGRSPCSRGIPDDIFVGVDQKYVGFFNEIMMVTRKFRVTMWYFMHFSIQLLAEVTVAMRGEDCESPGAVLSG